jgi:hypothetical protein
MYLHVTAHLKVMHLSGAHGICQQAPQLVLQKPHQQICHAPACDRPHGVYVIPAHLVGLMDSGLKNSHRSEEPSQI